jgi:uncharacterized membrane protein
VLEVHVPQEADVIRYGGLLPALLHGWPTYLSYLATFLTVGVIWLNHHSVFQKIRHVDRALQWWNLILLLLVSFTPFPNALLAEYLGDVHHGGLLGRDARVAAAVYAIVLAAATLPWLAIWLHVAKHPDLLEPGWTRAYAKREVKRSSVGVVVYSVGITVAFAVPLLAIVLFLLAAVYYAATSGGSRRRRR